MTESREEGEKVDYITFDVLRQRAYLDAFNILPKSDVASPLDYVSVRSEEDHIKGGPLESRIYRYRLYGVADRFHVSLIEFLSLPRHIVEFILSICAEEFQKEIPEQKKSLDALRGIDKKL